MKNCEPLVFGTALAIEPTDWVFPALRESAVMLARGFPLTQYLAQVFAALGDKELGLFPGDVIGLTDRVHCKWQLAYPVIVQAVPAFSQ